jgi:hypothetical protein
VVLTVGAEAIRQWSEGQEAVLGACLAIYAARGTSANVTDWTHGDETAPAVVITEDRRIEVVLGGGDDPGPPTEDIETLAREGWQVVLVLPTAALGPAHRAFRGLPLLLQGWWRVGDDIHFGHHETP